MNLQEVRDRAAREGIQTSKTEHAHIGERGLSEKSDDIQSLPLCGTAHHREGPYSIHVLQKKFYRYHGIEDKDEIVNALFVAFTDGGLDDTAF